MLAVYKWFALLCVFVVTYPVNLSGQDSMETSKSPPTIDQIQTQSDLVIIGELVASSRLQPDLGIPNSSVLKEVREALAWIRSEISITAVLKGSADKKIGLQHYVFKSIPNGTDTRVNLVHFRRGKQQVSIEDTNITFNTKYLIFLRKLPNGDYEPTTGQLNANQSVYHLVPSITQFGQSNVDVGVLSKNSADLNE